MKRETFGRAADRAAQVLAAAQERQEPERPSHMCAAYGCPMWGSISDTVVGEARQRWCRFHFGEGGKHLADITTALRKARPLVDDVQRLRMRCASDEATPNDRPSLMLAEKSLAAAVREEREEMLARATKRVPSGD